MKSIKIIANTKGMGYKSIDDASIEVDFYPSHLSLIKSCWYAFKNSRNYDFIVINCDMERLLLQSLMRYIPTSSSCKLISVDTFMPVPETFSEKIQAVIKSILFNKVDVFIEYFKDTSGYEKYYHIEKEKFRYIPFKINSYKKVLGKINENSITDEGYIFCGGNTKRDFNTLISAARLVDYPFVIVTMENAVIKHHGSHLIEDDLPDNITVIRHDGSSSFLDHIAKARIVALPLKKLTISATGIGVYIACMSLGKCVIISSAPSVNGILTNEAIIIPPENTNALRKAIEKAYNDIEYREKVAKRGQKYALSLQGEERLYRSIWNVLLHESRC